MNLATTQDMFAYRLGAALTMEHDSLQMLGDLEKAARTDEVKGMFTHHAEETREQIDHLTQAFELAKLDLKERPSPTMKGLSEEGKMLLDKLDESLLDLGALSAASGTEHFEIAAYRSLITFGEMLGLMEVCTLLQQNLEQEQHTSEELEQMLQRLGTEMSVGLSE